ncbi:carbohydrate binding domain-containing protein [Terrimicrobium sacchariphilum]|uniref:Carbohydrate binding domain-containing protein n=1 Tax=Terrimicrobium sacchariphilum TaxID=690879 RepID=A0A146G4E1_TERSA|nr:carbohydrate binding domain-containing protein [Terrimicrobium sacchariphilum]GAT31894.1 carbohydrate binding domain-containing protein [Terrimicrobium sacchariphilum]
MKTSSALLLTAALGLVVSLSSAHAQTELLKNGRFLSKLAGWELEAPASSGATAVVEDGGNGSPAVHITVPSATAHTYDVKLIQSIFHAPQDVGLKLSFRAKGEGKISVSLRVMGGNWDVLWKETVDLNGEWQEVQFDIPAAAWPGALRFDIGDLGAGPAQYWFSDLSLTTER